MNVETVIVCRDYSDYLKRTLPWTVCFSSRVVVVTSPEDLETQKVCESFAVESLKTEAFQYGGGPFNKGAAVNVGLSALSRRDWLLILDADIIIPNHVSLVLRESTLDTEKLYGVDRRVCNSDVMLNYVTAGKMDFFYLPLMKRIRLCGGEPPAGYFQLFHSSAMPCGPWYEETHGGADRTDVLFSKRFPKRDYLDTWVVHLDCGGHTGGVNWRGRKSPVF